MPMAEWSPPNTEYPPPRHDEPPLIRAARVGDHDAIRALVAAGAPIDDTFNIGLDPGARPWPATALMVGAGSGDGASAMTIELLLEFGADPRLTTIAGSAADFACRGLGWNYRPGGDAARLRLLLDAGSPLCLTGREGACLVAEAARGADAERLAILLERGGPTNAVFDPVTARNESRKFLGCLPTVPDNADEELREAIAACGESLEQFQAELMETMGEQFASAPSSFEIPLFAAAEGGCARCVRLLLDAGADVRCLDNSQHTALFGAGSPDVVRLLAQAGVNLTQIDRFDGDALRRRLEDLGDDETENARILAVCRAMIDVGVPLILPVEDEPDRLYDAAFAENPFAVRALLELGYPAIRPGSPRTALHALCWHWDHADERDEATRAIVRMLLDAGIDPNAREAGGNTPLHECVAGDGSNLVAAEVLLAAGADVNAQNEDGQTPLVYLYETLFDYERVVPFLLGHGANPLIPNARGKNAIDIARQMIRGENPDWRVEQWNEKGGPPCGWKDTATPGDAEYRMLELMIDAAKRFNR